ncbi:unnamed protein product [Onchocerca flexuosa]|uniref:50S ribosomal protein L15 n=1 Tax=Onchocerca flexuosa TaxID=387005 RepID=A0A183HT89_9BILA|nr:unnamed protein product [Onchocerca flexuosa]
MQINRTYKFTRRKGYRKVDSSGSKTSSNFGD